MGKFAILLEFNLRPEHDKALDVVKGHEASDSHKEEFHSRDNHFNVTQVHAHKVNDLKTHLKHQGYEQEKDDPDHPHHVFHKGSSEVQIHKEPSENGHHDVLVSTSHVNGLSRTHVSEKYETLAEGLRKVGEYTHGDRKATVHRDVEWGEYRVKHHVAGKYQGEDSDYHEDDKEQAHNHAKSWAEKTGANAVKEGTDRSEHSANLALHAQHGNSDGKKYHIYVRVKGHKKNIAGPFNSQQEAEKHPARPWADGVHSE